jgi:hypothetical protein
MRRILMGLLAGCFFAVPCVAQSANAGSGTAGMETPSGTPSGKTEAGKAGRKFLYDFNSPGPSYDNTMHDALQGCPVLMETTRLGGGDMVKVMGATEREPGQRIRLTLRDRSNSARVVGARVAVRGTDGKPRMSTLASGLADSTNRAGEVTKTVTLNFNDRGESWAAADMLLRGLTSVSRVRLESITYADGTSWQPEQGSSCSVVPSPMMLIAGR